MSEKPFSVFMEHLRSNLTALSLVPAKMINGFFLPEKSMSIFLFFKNCLTSRKRLERVSAYKERHLIPGSNPRISWPKNSCAYLLSFGNRLFQKLTDTSLRLILFGENSVISRTTVSIFFFK